VCLTALSIFAKSGTEVTTAKVRTSSLEVNIAPPLPLFCPRRLPNSPPNFLRGKSVRKKFDYPNHTRKINTVMKLAAVLFQRMNYADCNFSYLIMVALCNRADHYIFALWLLSIFFISSPNLSGRRLDVYHTSTHGVALVRI